MSFKDDLKDDVQKVFCNSDEFFEEHEVDGKPMMISIDEDELMRRNRAKGTHEQGVHDKQVLFYGRRKCIWCISGGRPSDSD